jgi:hypothetical protein
MEGLIMLKWFRTWLQEWASRVQQKEIEKLLEQGRRLKAQVHESNGGAPIQLTAEERLRLDAMRKEIDPEILKKIDLLAEGE